MKCWILSYLGKDSKNEGEEVEHQVGWHIRAANSSFWYDNSTKQGALIFVDGEKVEEEEMWRLVSSLTWGNEMWTS